MAAIYQWYVEQEIIFTTPLYPVEGVEGLNWAATVSGVYSLGVSKSATIGQAIFVEGLLETIKIYGLVAPSATIGWALFTEGELFQIFIDASGAPSATIGTAIFTEGTLDARKVTHIQPNEDEVHWGATITAVTRP